MLSSFFVAGLLALRSSAFLVVPLETHDINPVEAEDARLMTIDLECPGCPFPIDDEANMKTGVDSTLVWHIFNASQYLFTNQVPDLQK